MGIDWKRADTDGWDIEDVEKARTVADTCPRCGQASRLVERERVKNLTVFGVALVATERGGRVFECPLCRAAFEAPEGGLESPDDLDASVIDQLTGLHDQLDAVEEDLATWRSRVTLAARSSDAALAKDAQEMFERRSRAAAALRSEIEGLAKQLRRGSAADETAQAPSRRGLLGPASSPVTPDAADGEGAAPAKAAPLAAPVEDELAALRQKVAAKAAAPTAGAGAGAGAGAAKEDELTALKRRLGMLPAASEAPAAKAPTPAPEESGGEVVEDDEVAALKRRLRGGAAGTPTPSAPTPSAPTAGDDDEMADLKNKLRPRK